MTSYCPYLSTEDIIFTLQIFSRLYFHHAGMTLPGGVILEREREQGPNLQRMVVAAWALTWSFVGLRGIAFVGSQLFGAFVGFVSFVSSLRRRRLSSG